MNGISDTKNGGSDHIDDPSDPKCYDNLLRGGERNDSGRDPEKRGDLNERVSA